MNDASIARACRWGVPTDRFWERVLKTQSCWVWTGGKRRKGYGCLEWEGKKRGAHRVSWELHFGPVPDGLHVLHRCDNPPCIRPEHLFLGTNLENHADRVAKLRMRQAGVSP